MLYEEGNGKTAMLVAHNNKVCGVISALDTLREDAVRVLKELKDRGVRLVMLTGDNPRTAQAILREIPRDG